MPLSSKKSELVGISPAIIGHDFLRINSHNELEHAPDAAFGIASWGMFQEKLRSVLLPMVGLI